MHVFKEFSNHQAQIFIDTIQLYEAYLDAFDRGKTESGSRLSGLKKHLSENARFCKAARLNRVPLVMMSILKVLHGAKPVDGLVVVGDAALYAYEAAAGAFFDALLVPTRNLEVLLPELGVSRSDLLALLRKVDRSFRVPFSGQDHLFRVVNSSGFVVDVIESGEASGLPKISETIIGRDGLPAIMVAIDPVEFALRKLRLSGQENRGPAKGAMDRKQALAVLSLVQQYLPQHRPTSNQLQSLPADVVRMLDEEKKKLEDTLFPPGFDFEL